MRLLVLGGSWFAGRVLVEAAHAAGHQVTVFNRGQTPVALPAGVIHVRGDREQMDDLYRLPRRGPWDAVIDVPGVIPAVVRDSARALEPVTGRYVFVSTVSAYRDWPALAVSEESPLRDSDPDAHPGEWTWGTGVYGPLKAGAEAAVLREFRTDRSVILRPGAIVGRYEYGGRLTWWLDRARRGGRILAPGGPDRPVRPVEVRDLAAFVLHLIEDERSGAFNVAGPDTTWGDLLGACLDATGSAGELIWVDDAWLTDHGVKQWTELPLWRTAPGTWAVDTARATNAGLAWRPLSVTVADTWAWLSSGAVPVAHDRQAMHGLEPRRETELLAAWDRRFSVRPEGPDDPTGGATRR